MRTHWNELILDKKQREKFFAQDFEKEIDPNFFKFLLAKVIRIVDIINEILTDTLVEEV